MTSCPAIAAAGRFTMAAAVDASLREQVRAVLLGLYPAGKVIERRRERRYPYPHLLYLTPADQPPEASKSIVVVGKQLSERGLGFYHQQPLPHRRMIASLDAGDHWLGLLIDLTWCRFTRKGWYESGGRFLETVPSPIDSAQRAEAMRAAV
jgi:hypothetical protein